MGGETGGGEDHGETLKEARVTAARPECPERCPQPSRIAKC